MPDWIEHIRPHLTALRLSPAREAEIIEELSQHLDDRYRELCAEGATSADAHRLALADLHAHDLLSHHMKSLRQAHVPPPVPAGEQPSRWLPDVWRDVRYGIRMLRKQPGFTAAAVATLALGIGANTAIFSLVNGMLLQRLPVAGRDRLVYVHRGNVGDVFSYPMYERLRDGNHVFDGFAAWGGISASLNTGDATDIVSGAIVTGNLFGLLGITAERGRLLSTSDDVTPGAHPIVVLSHDLWQTRFAGRSDIVGHEIRLNGFIFTVVGITPAGFPARNSGSSAICTCR